MIGGARRAVALLVCAGLVVGACHSIDLGVFAQGPVPLSVLPLREPVTFTVGPNAGEAVPAQHGLLASYFSGAAYVQPSHGEVLDHQQIDPNVAFVWDASDTNPVIPPPAGIDHNDGDFRLPDHWPIWSIAWEGYLEAPGEGTYGLRLHVNNGGWLEMKDGSGALATVINCPGGTSFEGDCDGSRMLTAGRHYIRISYYNNAPSSASAIFSWRRPGESAFSVVPTEALSTQREQPPRRAMFYVHGTAGVARSEDFPSLFGPLRTRYQDLIFYEYREDRRFATSGTTCDMTRAPRQLPAFDRTAFGFDVMVPDSAICDSNDDIEFNGVLLDADVLELAKSFDRVTLISNSGGAAIVRAYLAYAAAVRSSSLDALDAVVFLEGSQAGTYIAALYAEGAAEAHRTPAGNVVLSTVVGVVNAGLGHDPARPARADLTPRSDVIRFTYRPGAVPDQPHYVNVVGDIVVHVRSHVIFNIRDLDTIEAGDLAILPGDDRPALDPPPDTGGARFLPAAAGIGASSTQWVLRRDAFVFLSEDLLGQAAVVVGLPESHLFFGRRAFGRPGGITEVCVNTPTGVKTVNDAVLDAIAALDSGIADPSRIGFGAQGSIRCPR